MPNKVRRKWKRPFSWPPAEWEFTPGMQLAADIVTAICFLMLVCTLVGALVLWPLLLARTLVTVSTGSVEDLRNVLLAVGALIGVPFLIWRTLIASKQTTINRESHYTALFTKAVEQLGAEKSVKRREFIPIYQLDAVTGKPLLKDGVAISSKSDTGEPLGEYRSYEITVTNYEVRLGAIYALERIAQDSERDAIPIYLTLCAYLQNNAPPAQKDIQTKQDSRNDSDLLEVLNVIARSSSKNDDAVSYEFNGIHLPDALLFQQPLKYVSFQSCSQLKAKFSCDIIEVTYKDCVFGRFEVDESLMSGVHMTAGSVDYLRMFACSIENSMIMSNLRSLIINTSQAYNSFFSLSNKTVLKRCEFVQCELQGVGPSIYQRFTPALEDSTFTGCKFVRCDFSFQDLSDNQFHDCRFVDCNCVRSGLSTMNGNRFENCVQDSDLSDDQLKDANQIWYGYASKYAASGLLD